MRVTKRRRRESKTDYRARLNLLKSPLPRIVFRKSNLYVNGQYVQSKNAQDSVLMSVTSKDLLSYGWPSEAKGSLKSIPACYLTGFLLSKKIKEKHGEVEAIFDLGLIRNIQKSRVFAFLNGIVDGGLNLRCDKEKFPPEERILGKHLKKGVSSEFNKIKEKIKNE
ncbi:MAG: 50S ribosomal protein L18 [archaeon]